MHRVARFSCQQSNGWTLCPGNLSYPWSGAFASGFSSLWQLALVVRTSACLLHRTSNSFLSNSLQLNRGKIRCFHGQMEKAAIHLPDSSASDVPSSVSVSSPLFLVWESAGYCSLVGGPSVVQSATAVVPLSHSPQLQVFRGRASLTWGYPYAFTPRVFHPFPLLSFHSLGSVDLSSRSSGFVP